MVSRRSIVLTAIVWAVVSAAQPGLAADAGPGLRPVNETLRGREKSLINGTVGILIRNFIT
jgi:hypothetical protein